MGNIKAIGLIALVATTIFLAAAQPIYLGIGGWGPTTTTAEATVTGKHIDISGGKGSKQSHYMVNTDKGTFEVDNGIMLGIWNADEIYGKLEINKVYNITAQGNKVVGWFYQEYPYITRVEKTTVSIEQR